MLNFSDFLKESIQLNDIGFNVTKSYNHNEDTIHLKLVGITREDSRKMLNLDSEQTKLIFSKIRGIFSDVKLQCTFKFDADWTHITQGNTTKQVMGIPKIIITFRVFEVIDSLVYTLTDGMNDLKTQGMNAKDFFEHE